jgi:hypothetical protein
MGVQLVLHLAWATATVLAVDQEAVRGPPAVQAVAVAVVAPLYCCKMVAWLVCQQVAVVALAPEFGAVPHPMHPMPPAKLLQDITDKMVKTIQVMAAVAVGAEVAGMEQVLPAAVVAMVGFVAVAILLENRVPTG